MTRRRNARARARDPHHPTNRKPVPLLHREKCWLHWPDHSKELVSVCEQLPPTPPAEGGIVRVRVKRIDVLLAEDESAVIEVPRERLTLFDDRGEQRTGKP